MIRNVTTARLRPDVDPALVDRAVAEIQTLEIEGMGSIVAGVDLGFKPGNWSLAITADFVDEAAYHRYDTDVEHNRMRKELFAPICQDMARAQFLLPD
jgi:hypothetical protein